MTWEALCAQPAETGAHYLKYRRLLSAAETVFAPQLLALGNEELSIPYGGDLPEYRASRQSQTSGEKTESAIRWWLNNLGYKRSMLQIRMHNEIINALLSQIYGKDFDQDIDAILSKKRLARYHSDVVLQTGRRMGKSWGTAMIIVALMLTIPAFEVMVFSLSKDNAKKMIELVRGMIPAEFVMYIKKDNQTRVAMRLPGDPHGSYRSITALSSSDVVRRVLEEGEKRGVGGSQPGVGVRAWVARVGVGCWTAHLHRSRLDPSDAPVRRAGAPR